MKNAIFILLVLFTATQLTFAQEKEEIDIYDATLQSIQGSQLSLDLYFVFKTRSSFLKSTIQELSSEILTTEEKEEIQKKLENTENLVLEELNNSIEDTFTLLVLFKTEIVLNGMDKNKDKIDVICSSWKSFTCSYEELFPNFNQEDFLQFLPET